MNKKILLIIIFFLVFHFLRLSAANEEISASDKYTLAKSLYSDDKFQEAFDLASELISVENYEFDSQFLIGLCLRKISSNEKAISYFQNLINNEPSKKNLQKLNLTLARIYYSNNNFSKALKAYYNYIKIVEFGNLKVEILYEIGWCAIYDKNYLFAEKCFNKVITKEPRSKFYDKSQFSIAVVSAKQDNLDAAINIVEKRISENENIYEYIEEKERVLVLYDEILISKSKASNETFRKTIEEQKKELQSQLYVSNIILEQYLGEEIDSQELIKLAILEEEIVSHALLLEGIKSLEILFSEEGKDFCSKKAQKKYSDKEILLKEAESDINENFLNAEQTENSNAELKEMYFEEQKIVDSQLEELYKQREKLANRIESEYKESLLKEIESNLNESVLEIEQAIDSNTELKDLYLEEQKLVDFQLEELNTQREKLTNKIEIEFSEGLLKEAESNLNESVLEIEQAIDSNTELKDLYLEEQKLVDFQLEELNTQREKLANKIEMEFMETLFANKKVISGENVALEKDYSEIFVNLKEKNIKNPEMYEYLQEKERLFELYKMIVIAKSKTTNENSKKIVTEHEKELKAQLDESNIVLAQYLGDEVDAQELIRLTLLEEEIVSYSILLEEIKNLEVQFAETGKEIASRKAEKRLSDTEQLLTGAQSNLIANIAKLEENIKFNAELRKALESDYQNQIKNLAEKRLSDTEQLLTGAQSNLIANIAKLEENIKFNTELKKALESDYQNQIKNLEVQFAETGKEIASKEAEKRLSNTEQLLTGAQSNLIANIAKLEENIKSNIQSKNEYQERQLQIKSQLDELNNQREQFIVMIEEKFNETFENKKDISYSKDDLESDYQKMFVKLKEIVQRKIELSYFALGELLLEQQAIINYQYSYKVKELSEQQRYYRELLEKAETE